MPATAAKERSVCLRPWEVRAILAGQKTQFRRLVDPQPPADKTDPEQTLGGIGWKWWGHCVHKYDDNCWPKGEIDFIFCPFGKPGDRLHVLEDWWSDWREPGVVVYDATPEFGKYQNTGQVVRATFPDCKPVSREDARAAMLPKFWSKQPAETMPRWASRLTLEITEVRVERLNEISEADAIAEGLIPVVGPNRTPLWEYSKTQGGQFADPRVAFRMLWESIHAKRPGCAWADSPWVWVVSFRKLDPA